MLVDWNDTDAHLPPVTAADLFREAVGRQPSAVAVEHAGETLDYAELERAARGVAGELLRHGVQAGDLVGVHFDRSPRLVAALLGTMLAGAAFVPLDPAYPAA